MTQPASRQRESLSLEDLAITSCDPARVAEVLRLAQEHFFLISPAATCEGIAPGYEVASTYVLIDVKRETYSITGDEESGRASGKVALHKVALERLASAAALSWVSSRRTDDRSNPFYCSWEAQCEVRLFDGTRRLETGAKEMDLRHDSTAVTSLHERYEAKRRTNPRAKDPTAQIREMRLHIASHAESKAKLRAIRAALQLTTYDAEELRRKPFVVARMVATGRIPGNPELEREITLMRFREEFAPLGARRALFGAPEVRALPPRPPPTVHDDFDDLEDDALEGEIVEAPRAKPVASAPRPAAPASPRWGGAPAQGPVAQRAPKPQAAPEPPTEFVIPGGRERDVPLDQASDSTLRYWSKTLREKVTQNRARPGDEDLVEAMETELAERERDGRAGR